LKIALNVFLSNRKLKAKMLKIISEGNANQAALEATLARSQPVTGAGKLWL
jgi:hypothetical protein